MFDKDRRPYVKSPLMAQYFAGHMQTHYKRIVVAWVLIFLVVFGGAARFLNSGSSGGGVGHSPTSPATNQAIWDFLEWTPYFGDRVFYRMHGPHYDGPDPVYPEDPIRANDPLYQHLPTSSPTTAAAHVDESGGESTPPPDDASGDGDDFYTCTPGTKWCTP